jgi:hypothetical protein
MPYIKIDSLSYLGKDVFYLDDNEQEIETVSFDGITYQKMRLDEEFNNENTYILYNPQIKYDPTGKLFYPIGRFKGASHHDEDTDEPVYRFENYPNVYEGQKDDIYYAVNNFGMGRRRRTSRQKPHRKRGKRGKSVKHVRFYKRAS